MRRRFECPHDLPHFLIKTAFVFSLLSLLSSYFSLLSFFFLLSSFFFLELHTLAYRFLFCLVPAQLLIAFKSFMQQQWAGCLERCLPRTRELLSSNFGV
jgi:hypothetical protein